MSKIDSDLIKKIDVVLQDRYSRRLEQFGNDPRTLGWDTQENQRTRFELATKTVDMSGSSILDVGCGLGDFNVYLKENKIGIAQYSGSDLNPDLVEFCREMDPGSNYEAGNFLLDSPEENSVDIVCMFGVLNFRFSEFSNVDFARNMIRKAFTVARKAVVVDMLTARVDENYATEGFVYYYEPIDMLDFAFSLTPHVQLRHDYKSIPQREMMLMLRKHS